MSSDKSWTFKQKLEFRETCIHHNEPDILSVPTDFSDEIDGDNNVIEKMFYDEMFA